MLGAEASAHRGQVDRAREAASSPVTQNPGQDFPKPPRGGMELLPSVQKPQTPPPRGRDPSGHSWYGGKQGTVGGVALLKRTAGVQLSVATSGMVLSVVEQRGHGSPRLLMVNPPGHWVVAPPRAEKAMTEMRSALMIDKSYVIKIEI